MRALIAFLVPLFSLFALVPRAHPVELKTSVIIPCHSKHVQHLPTMLQWLAEQTVVPDEVVICFTRSQVATAPAIAPDYPFAVRCVFTDRSYPANARNTACEESSGDLLICQDADDVPHPRRVEIIKHLFEHYQIDILLHRWSPSSETFEPYTVEESIPLALSVDLYAEVEPQFDFIHNGSPALLKAVTQRVKWPPMPLREDMTFNAEVFRYFPHKVVLDERLVIYRFELSSYKDRYARPGG